MERLGEMIVRLSDDGFRMESPIIGFAGGPDLPYLKGKVLRCFRATLLAKLDNENEILEFDPNLPYGFLHIEGSDLPPKCVVALIHKLDFINAWRINDMNWFEEDTFDVMVRYRTAGGFRGLFGTKTWPMFEYTTVSPSSGERFMRLYGLEEEHF